MLVNQQSKRPNNPRRGMGKMLLNSRLYLDYSGLSGEKMLVQNETTIFSKALTSSSSMICPAAKDSTTISAICVNNYLYIYLVYLYFDYLSFYVYGKKQCIQFNSF